LVRFQKTGAEPRRCSRRPLDLRGLSSRSWLLVPSDRWWVGCGIDTGCWRSTQPSAQHWPTPPASPSDWLGPLPSSTAPSTTPGPVAHLGSRGPHTADPYGAAWRRGTCRRGDTGANPTPHLHARSHSPAPPSARWRHPTAAPRAPHLHRGRPRRTEPSRLCARRCRPLAAGGKRRSPSLRLRGKADLPNLERSAHTL